MKVMASRTGIPIAQASHLDPRAAFRTVLSILQKTPSSRKQDDLNTLVPLLQQIEFFKSRKLKLPDYKAIAQCLTYECYQNGQTVIEYGTYGTKFYVILKGTVGVFVPWSAPGPQVARKNSRGQESSSQAQDAGGAESKAQPEFKEVVVLEEGMSFGELALITCKPRYPAAHSLAPLRLYARRSHISP